MKEKYNYKSIYSIIRDRIISGEYPNATLLPPETALASEYGVSRPTVAKVYNRLERERLVERKKGRGTLVSHVVYDDRSYTFGLLLPGAGESEIFATINNRLLSLSKEKEFECLWDGATASNAYIRRNLIETCCSNYIEKHVDGIFFSPLERVSDAVRLNIEICERIERAGIPLVLIDRDVVAPPEKSRFDVVGLDNYNAATVMARLGARIYISFIDHILHIRLLCVCVECAMQYLRQGFIFSRIMLYVEIRRIWILCVTFH